MYGCISFLLLWGRNSIEQISRVSLKAPEGALIVIKYGFVSVQCFSPYHILREGLFSVLRECCFTKHFFILSFSGEHVLQCFNATNCPHVESNESEGHPIDVLCHLMDVLGSAAFSLCLPLPVCLWWAAAHTQQVGSSCPRLLITPDAHLPVFKHRFLTQYLYVLPPHTCVFSHLLQVNLQPPAPESACCSSVMSTKPWTLQLPARS